MSGKRRGVSGPGWFGEPERHSLAARGIGSGGGVRPVVGGDSIRLRSVPRSLSEDVAGDLASLDLSTARYLADMEDRQRAGLLQRELVSCGLVAEGKTLDWLKEKAVVAKDVVVGGIKKGVQAVKEKSAERKEAKAFEREKEHEATVEAKKKLDEPGKKPDKAPKTTPTSAKKKMNTALAPYTAAIKTEDGVSPPSAADLDVGKDEYTRYMMGQVVDADAIQNIVENKKDLIYLSRTLQADSKSIENLGVQFRAEFDILEKNMKSKWNDESRFMEDKFKKTWSGVDLKDEGMRLAYGDARRELEQGLELKKEGVRAQIRQHQIDVDFLHDKAGDFMKVAEGVRNRAMIG